MSDIKKEGVEERLDKTFKSLRSRTDFVPDVALVLGSGLGDFAESLDNKSYVAYADIDGMPVSTVVGHNGRFFFGDIDGVKTVVMQGRVHHYEGYSMEEVVLPIRLMKLMGAKVLFLTNASGGINESFKQGDLMMITDHISSFVRSPLIGANIEKLGTRFPDMSEVYDRGLQEHIIKTAGRLDIELKSGVYVQTTGPNYETPAEIRMYRALGADAVGMSTACEAMCGNHMGMKVMGISCITNMAAGISKSALSHKDVAQVADKSSKAFHNLVWNVISGLRTIDVI